MAAASTAIAVHTLLAMVRSTLRPEPPPSVVVALLSTVPLVPLPVPLSPVAVPTAIVATEPPALPHQLGAG